MAFFASNASRGNLLRGASPFEISLSYLYEINSVLLDFKLIAFIHGWILIPTNKAKIPMTIHIFIDSLFVKTPPKMGIYQLKFETIY